MVVTFPPQSVFDFNALAVAFPVEVDGARYRTLVSVEALQGMRPAMSS